MEADKRMKAFHAAEKILMDDAVIAPVFFQTNPVMIRSQVKGVRRSILGVPYLKEAYLAP